jgi:signal transduction histidine kinase
MVDIQKKITYIHFSGWSLAFAFLFWVFWSEGLPNPLILSGTLIFISLFVFYSHLFILSRYLDNGKYVKYTGALLVIVVFSPFLIELGKQFKVDEYGLAVDQHFPVIIITLLCAIFSRLVKAAQDRFINILKKQDFKKQAVQTELSYLKSQINPHFLFNTLNNIHTLAYTQSTETPETIMRLSSLLRYMLYESNSETVALERDIEHLQDFINLQQLRYENAHIVKLDITGDITHCKVAPFLFIHLLENAYKHSPGRLRSGDISVKIEAVKDMVSFCITNPINPIKASGQEDIGGIGLKNLQKRLTLLYPNRHKFITHADDHLYSVTLELA